MFSRLNGAVLSDPSILSSDELYDKEEISRKKESKITNAITRYHIKNYKEVKA